MIWYRTVLQKLEASNLFREVAVHFGPSVKLSFKPPDQPGAEADGALR